MDWQQLTKNKYIPWNLELILKFEECIYPWDISNEIANVLLMYIDLDIIEKVKTKIKTVDYVEKLGTLRIDRSHLPF